MPKPGEQLSVLAISVDDPGTSRELAARLEEGGRENGPLLLLSDPGHATIDAYGLHDPAYDGTDNDGIPRAAVYVVGRDGRIAWAHVSEDYKKRPSNAEIRAALDALATRREPA